jgi:hypothetical protein
MTMNNTNLLDQEVYLPVSVEDELPTTLKDLFVIAKDEFEDLDLLVARLTNAHKNEWYAPFRTRTNVTHWLKKTTIREHLGKYSGLEGRPGNKVSSNEHINELFSDIAEYNGYSFYTEIDKWEIAYSSFLKGVRSILELPQLSAACKETLLTELEQCAKIAHTERDGVNNDSSTFLTEEGLEPGGSNDEGALVASHTCTEGNSIEL